jgi:hypothetical protein
MKELKFIKALRELLSEEIKDEIKINIDLLWLEVVIIDNYDKFFIRMPLENIHTMSNRQIANFIIERYKGEKNGCEKSYIK